MVGQYLLRRFDCRSSRASGISRIDSSRSGLPYSTEEENFTGSDVQSSRRRRVVYRRGDGEASRRGDGGWRNGRRSRRHGRWIWARERSRAVVKNEGTKRGIARMELDALRRGNMGRPDYVGTSTAPESDSGRVTPQNLIHLVYN